MASQQSVPMSNHINLTVDDILQHRHYRMIIEGQTDALKDEFSTHLSNSKLSDMKWGSGNSTMLHVAVSAGQTQLIPVLLSQDKDLLLCPNKKGDLPIHFAARDGNKDAIDALILHEVKPPSAGNGSIRTSISQLEQGNNHRNTALHIALLNQHNKEVASYLFENCRQTFYSMNTQGICPLYLAIEAGFWELVSDMLSLSASSEVEEALREGRSAVLAVIMARNKDMLKKLDEKYGRLVAKLDEKGRNMLGYAAQIGFLDGVKYLLKNHQELAWKQDDDGCYPIHKACSGGDVQVVKQFLYCFPQMKHFRNDKDQNILHVAAENGKDGVVKYLLEIKELINKQDIDGNTPLHLATMGYHSKVVYRLTRDHRVKLRLQNELGFTAFSLLHEIYYEEEAHSFRLRLTLVALVSADGHCSQQCTEEDHAGVSSALPASANTTKNNTNNYKDRFNTLLMVSTLVATVTFAANFTLPGGYNSSTKDIGMATLSHRRAFQVFVLSNTIAMHSSVFSAVTLIWAYLDDVKLSVLCLDFALPSLGIALTMMSVAFMAGLFVVLHNMCNWLAVGVLIMGGLFLVAVLTAFIPLYSPTCPIKNKHVRCIFEFLFWLMLLACDLWSGEKLVY